MHTLKSRKVFPFSATQKLAMQKYGELLQLKNYSENTISVYKNWFGIFLRSFPGRKPSTITKNEIMEFLTEYKKSDRWSATTQNQLINAIKFFYEKVINRPREMYELPRAQKPFRIPSVFAGGWFTLFAAVAFPQHKMIF